MVEITFMVCLFCFGIFCGILIMKKFIAESFWLGRPIKVFGKNYQLIRIPKRKY